MPDPARLGVCQGRHRWLGAGGAWGAIWVAPFVVLVVTTWGTWGHLIIDTGVAMYTPWVLASGKVLYRDVFYAFGPFTPYFHALLYKLFAPHLVVLYASGLATCVLTAWLVQRLASRHLPPWLAAYTALYFVLANAFGNYMGDNIFNYPAPYSYTAVHSMLFSLAALWFHGRRLETRRTRDRALELACIFLALLSRYEIGALIAVALAFGTLVHGPQSETRRRWLVREAGALFLPVLAAASVYGVFLLAARESPFFDSFEAILSGYDFSENSGEIYSRAMGLIELEGNILEVLKSLGGTIASGLSFGAAAFCATRAVRRPRRAGTAISWSASAAALAGLGYWLTQHIGVRLAIKYLPLLAAILLLEYARRTRHLKGDQRRDAVELATLACFSLLAVWRILLRTNFGFYGFYLTVPGLILSRVFLLRDLPALMPVAALKPFVTAGFLIHGLVMITGLQASSFSALRAHTLRVESPRGTILVRDTARNQCVKRVADALAALPAPKPQLVVFPEGVGINFMTGLENPLYQHTYLPYDLAAPGAVAAVVHEMELTKPEYVIQVLRNVRAFGSQGFEIDYGAPIMDYLDRTYDLVHYEPNACMLLRRRGGT